MILPILLALTIQIHPDSAETQYRQPQLAAAHGQVALTFGSTSAIYFSPSPDGGHSFAPPVKVSDVGALALGRHRGPRLVILEKALVISAVAGEKKSEDAHAHGLPENGNLLVWRSTDHGHTWTRGGTINDVPGAAREGLHSMTADAKGRLFAVWLDLRDKGTRLYGSRSTDGGLTWSKNALVYESPEGTICQCCHPTALFDENGELWTMWRNSLAGSRDFYVTTSADSKTFANAHKLGTGTWKLNACPMDGGGFTVDHGQVTSAWRRDDTVFLANNDQSETPIGKGKDVALAKTSRGVFVAWSNGEALDLLKPGAAQPAPLTPHGSFVNLVALPSGDALAAWETNGTIEVSVLLR